MIRHCSDPRQGNSHAHPVVGQDHHGRSAVDDHDMTEATSRKPFRDMSLNGSTGATLGPALPLGLEHPLRWQTISNEFLVVSYMLHWCAYRRSCTSPGAASICP